MRPTLLRRTIAIASVATLAGGCAAPPTMDRLRDGESLKLVISQAPSEGVVDIHNASLGKNGGTGASTGGVAGGLWGLACGPLAILCVPLGAGVGALAGTASGAVVGATASLSDDKATQLRDRVSRSVAAHELGAQLRRNVDERAQRHWDLASGAPGFVLNVELGNIELTSTRDEMIGMVLRAHATLQRSGAPATPAPSVQAFECSSAPSNLTIWLDDRSDFVDTVLANCTQQLAAQLVSEMTLR